MINRRDISYGVQLTFERGGQRDMIRLYENTKGKRSIDTSLTKSDKLKALAGGTHQSAENPLLAPPLIGSDEAGKGDWLGPLTVCALYADEVMYEKLAASGVKDSKKLTPGKIEKLKDEILAVCPHYSIIVITPSEFNRLYEQKKNINLILTAAHAAAIKSVYAKSGCGRVLIDKFAPEYRIAGELGDYPLEIHQENRAEANFAVAAASILARYTYMAKLKQMSEKYGIDFPPGAANAANTAAGQFAAKYGKEFLGDICKISFKNTQKI